MGINTHEVMAADYPPGHVYRSFYLLEKYDFSHPQKYNWENGNGGKKKL